MLGVTRAGGITGTEWDWLVLQKQYDDQYSVKSNSIATSYQNAMASYTAKSNSIATSYNNAMSSYHQASTAASQANQQVDNSYNAALQSYNNAMNALTQDQHKHDQGTLNWGVPGHSGRFYARVNWSTDVTWHWDKNQNTVVVTGVRVNLQRVNPTYRGGGFWDAVVIMNPNVHVPQEGGTFTHRQGDLPGTNGNSLWQRIGGGGNSGIFAFFTQNNNTEANTIKYDFNTTLPFNAVNNGNGNYTLLTGVRRLNNGAAGNLSVFWENNWITVQVHVPVPPTPGTHTGTPPTPPNPNRPTKPTVESVTRKIASVSYHSNTLILFFLIFSANCIRVI